MLATLHETKLEIAREFPDFKIVPKTDSRLMKVIDLFLKIITFWRMKAFMTSFVTTVGHTVYVPSHWPKIPERSRISVLRHERIHMQQAKRMGRVWFSLYYLFFPLPALFAYGRMKLEREAYEESMRTSLAFFGLELLKNPSYKADMIRHFTSAEYFWMWPWKSSMEKWYDATVLKLTRESMFNIHESVEVRYVS